MLLVLLVVKPACSMRVRRAGQIFRAESRFLREYEAGRGRFAAHLAQFRRGT